MSITPHQNGPAMSGSYVGEHKSGDADLLRKFLPLISKSKDIYFIVEAGENRFRYCNDAVTEVLGFSQKEVSAMLPKAFVTNASMDSIRDALPRALAAHSRNNGDTVAVSPLHIQLIAKNRTRVSAELFLTVFLNQDHTATHYTGVVRCEFVKRPVHEQPVVFEPLFVELFNTLPFGCIVCTPDVGGDVFLLKACNRAAEKMTGISADTGIGKDISELLPELHQNEVLPVMRSVAQTGIAVKLPVVINPDTDGGECREYHICRMTGGVVVTLFGDAGALRHQVDLAKGTIELFSVVAGKIAHDLNNTGTLLFGQVDLALSSLNPASETAKQLQPVVPAFNRMRNLTGRLSVLSRKTPLQKRGTDTAELIHSVAVGVFRGTNIEYSVRTNSDNVEIMADSNLLAYAFRLLLENARTAMSGEGAIAIYIERQLSTTQQLQVGTTPGITITITDTGCGIPQAQQRQLFTPVFPDETDKPSRNGLSVVYSIISRHGGNVSLDSEPGKGTTVTVALPAGDSVPASSSGDKEALLPQPSSGPGRVLIMDDEDILLDIAKQMCRRIGLTPTITENSQQAIEQYREEFRKGTPYDLVLLDLTIAGGIGGMETAALLKKIDPSVKTVAMSGYTDHEVMAEPGKYGFTSVLNKPFRLGEFSMVLKSILPAEKFKED